jgi:5-hydroxyisourate hydrolase-like protein (transthyretin family)
LSHLASATVVTPRRRGPVLFLTAAISAVLMIAGLLSGVSPAQADPGTTGTISGTLRLPWNDPVPSNDGQVRAYRVDVNGDAVQEGLVPLAAGGIGAWSFDSLPVGDYVFSFEYVGLDNVFSTFTGGFATLDEALASATFESIGEDETRVIDVTLPLGGMLYGTVTQSGGAPEVAAEVEVWHLDGESWQELAQTTTDDSGWFTVDHLLPGQYTVHYVPASDASPEWWDDAYVDSAADADQLTLEYGDGGHDVSTEVFALGTVAGSVLTSSGSALSGVEVVAYEEADGSWEIVGSTTTDSSGHYDLSLPPGDYRVGAEPGSLSAYPAYLPRFYPSATTVEAATTISLEASEARTLPAFKLTRSSVIAGTISLAGGGHPAESDIRVIACAIDDPCFEEWDNAGTSHYNATTGVYSVDGLAAGSYNLFVQYLGAGNFRDEYYSNRYEHRLATAIVVGTSTTVTGKSVTLDVGAQISGTVTDGASAFEGVTVGAYRVTSPGYAEWEPERTTTTDNDGHYLISGLDGGTYVIKAIPADGSGFAARWFGGTYSSETAEPVEVAIPNSVGSVDISLEQAGTISGTIVAADDGEPIQGAWLSLYRFDSADGTYFEFDADGASADDNGSYEFAAVPPGQYALAAEQDGFLERFYSTAAGVTHPPLAARFQVGSGDSIDASFALDRGGEYIGRIVDASGTGIEGVSVGASRGGGETTTDADGAFRLPGQKEGAHTLTIQTLDVPGFVRSTTYDAPATTVNSLPVDLGDIEIEAGSTLNGVVRSTGGTALAKVLVNAYVVGAGGALVEAGEAYSASNGTFTLEQLPSEAVYLRFDGSKTYPVQFLGGSTVWSLSDPVIIETPGETVRAEARLVTGGAVTGIVKNKVSGRAIAGVTVAVSQSELGSGAITSYQATKTNSAGTYILPGIEAGGYDISFNVNEYGTGPGLAYSTKQGTVTVPARTTVKVNATLSPSSKVSGVVHVGTEVFADVQVIAQRVGGGSVETRTTATGSYSMYLYPGSWTLFFIDPKHRAASGYFSSSVAGGVASVTSATKITVTGNGARYTGRNITLGTTNSSIAGGVTSAVEPDPTGSFRLERLEDGEVVSSELFQPAVHNRPLSELFPIRNVRPGTYRLVVNAESRLSEGGGYYPELTGQFVMNANDEAYFAIDVGTPTWLSESEDPEPVAGSEPVIGSDGSPQVEEDVFVAAGTWTRTPQYFFYQWTRNGKPIPGATGEVYTLTPGDAGATIAVNVGASDYDTGYPPYSYTATLEQPITAGDAPVSWMSPSVSGSPYVAQTLKVLPGMWDLPGLTFDYQWLRDGAPIAGATAVTYKPVVADVYTDATPAELSVEITARRTGFGSTALTIAVPHIMPAVALKQTIAATTALTVDGFRVTSKGSWTPTPTTYSYEWREYDTTSGAATTFGDNSATVVAPDQRAATTRITVVITASRAGYTSTSVEVAVRTGPTPVFVTPPSQVTGDMRVGRPVSVDLAGVGIAPGTSVLRYQWYRAGVAISGATALSYTPKATDAGVVLSVKVSLTAKGYASPSAFVELFSPPIAATDSLNLFFPPPVAGTVAVGRTLTVGPALWDATPTSTSYRWLRDGVVIPLATASTYTVKATDAGKEISVEVTARLGSLTGVTTVVAGTAVTSPPLNFGLPSVGTTARVGVKLTASKGTWDLTPTSYRYQWLLNGLPITGATSSTYTPLVADLGEELAVSVVAIKTGYGSSAPAVSASVTVAAGAAAAATAAPVVTVNGVLVSSVKLGQTITSTGATWPAVAESLSYQWQVAESPTGPWIDLADQTAATLLLDAANPTDFAIGLRYRVVVTATRAGYLPASSTSRSLAIVP